MKPRWIPGVGLFIFGCVLFAIGGHQPGFLGGLDDVIEGMLLCALGVVALVIAGAISLREVRARRLAEQIAGERVPEARVVRGGDVVGGSPH